MFRCACWKPRWESVIQLHKRQALVFVIALAAACVAAGVASGDPSIDAKRTQAQGVLAQINRLDSGLERARTQYEASTRKLHAIDRSLSINRVALRAAKQNLKTS